MNEIERKYIVKKLPDLTHLQPIYYERHFLYFDSIVEMRIQKKGEKFEFERKVKSSDEIAQKQKFEITRGEFEELKKKSIGSIIRKSYLLSQNPEISLKMYDGDFKGLNRVEVEFESIDEMESFEVLSWFGEEITQTQLGKDSKLITLSKEKFESLLKKYT